MSVCSSQLLNQVVDFHENQHRGYAIEDHLHAIPFNPVASTIKK
jgi:hypothetical protein